MSKLHEKLGISPEQFEQMLKNPKGVDPITRDRIMNATRFGGLKIAIGVALPVILFGAGLFFGINYYTSVILEQTAEIPGDPSSFDPIASLDEVRAHAGEGARLTAIGARHVGKDGTLDVTRTDPYSPRVEYDFFLEADPGEKEVPPIGAGGVEGGFWYRTVKVDLYEPGQWRHVVRMGGGGRTEYSYRNQGMDRDEGSLQYGKPVEAPNPACPFSLLWEAAITKGAPGEAVADIGYSLTYDGKPEYKFRIHGTHHNYSFDGDCEQT